VPLLSLNAVEDEELVITLQTSSHSGWQHLILMLSSQGKFGILTTTPLPLLLYMGVPKDGSEDTCPLGFGPLM
jgi:hypothetical protein